MILHLTPRWQVLNWHRRNAKPIHLQCHPVAVAKNISDRVSLALKKLLTAFGSLEGFGKIGRRSMRRNPIRHFLYGHVLCKKLASASPVAPFSIARMYSRGSSPFVGMSIPRTLLVGATPSTINMRLFAALCLIGLIAA